MKPLRYAVSLMVVLLSFSFPAFAQNDIRVTPYPNATEMTGETTRLLEIKSSSWIAARAYRTDDSIREVVKHFQQQAEKAKRPAAGNEILRRLFEDNWRVTDSSVRAASDLFIANKDFKSVVQKDAKISFGTILLDDSLVRVHIMSPYPASPTGETVAKGTMIVLVREKLPAVTRVSENADVDEKVYTGREVTRKVRLLSKPEPSYVGRTGIVVLKAVFGSSGKVIKIEVVSGVPELAEVSIRAARQITFEPAIKDGRFVAMWMQLEYNFN
jgi:hypothetical protein